MTPAAPSQPSDHDRVNITDDASTFRAPSGLFLYDDADYDGVIREAGKIAPYELTGAVLAQHRAAIVEALEVLRFAAGNFYYNDKPTCAVVGQQPFGVRGRAAPTTRPARS